MRRIVNPPVLGSESETPSARPGSESFWDNQKYYPESFEPDTSDGEGQGPRGRWGPQALNVVWCEGEIKGALAIVLG
jgi:hypothetical protein